MSTEKKLTNDATASVSAIIYQICVALERAFMLEEGQKLWIEKFGDVTVSESEQIEIKQYSDSLTDSHLNFWNTLKNWLNPGFNHQKYRYLTLFTTQSIGPASKLLEWNDAVPSKRHEILKTILDQSERRHEKTQDSKALPQSLADCRFVLGHTRLAEIIPKIYIASDSPTLNDLSKKIIDRYGKTILQAKCNDFLADLIGYLLSPSTIHNGWEVSFEDFSARLTMVSNRYRRGTVIFPARNTTPSTEQVELQKEKRFVQKLHEIRYQCVISEAIRHYLSASITIIEDFKNYDVHPTSYQTYQSNLKQSQQTRRRAAMRRLANDAISESQNFYDDLTGEAPQSFPAFEQTPIEFRNGVFHMLADDESDDFQWRLWE